MKRGQYLFARLENARAVVAIRSGLVMVIPVLMIGSAMLVLKYFPITQYQSFVESALSGNLLRFYTLIYDATFGMLSVFITLTISFCYARQFNNERLSIAPPLTALVCFFVLSGVRIDVANWDALGVKGMSIAILSSILATRLFVAFMAIRRRRPHRYAGGADIEFNNSVSAILPASAVVAVFAFFNLFITRLFNVNSFFELFVAGANAVFLPLGRSFAAGLLMVCVSSLLWFFGIHGSNVLEAVMDNLFTPAVAINAALVQQGLAPTELFTKEFFDTFVLMGGCGTAICLLLAILLFSRRKSNRRLARLAAVPMLFNINELMIFGLPVIFNPTLFIPFIATPILAFLTTYAAMRLGLVPFIPSEVNWTAPVLISGYIATGSFAGSVLQLVNIIGGVLLYRPFILAYDRQREVVAQRQLERLVERLKQSEETTVPVTLTELTDEQGAMARFLVEDLKYALSQNTLELYYQPQYDNKSVCIGLEALLRWKHPLHGMIYPPLVIHLASEGNVLFELETYILRRAMEDGRQIRVQAGFAGEISVNVSFATIQSDGYLGLLQKLKADGALAEGALCLEITEQTAMLANEETFERLRAIRNMGYRLAIDDFSMGHTSLTYLQESQFDLVKLDGTLVRGMLSNPRSHDIICSITSLSRRLGFGVIAEFVEEPTQVRMLEEAGCFQYQGYLFSPALPREALIARLKAERR